MDELWPALILSLRIAGIATVATAIIGIPLAWAISRATFRGKAFVETLIALPLILPPTVVGYLLIALFGVQGPLGGWLDRHLDVRFLFSETAAIVAATVVSLPLLFLPARAAFAAVDRELEDVARLMGAGRLRLFWHVSLPLARRGIWSGLLLAFARSLGEFGATVMVFGVTRKTLPVLIWYDNETSGLTAAVPAVCLLLAVSLGVMAISQRWR